MTKALNGQLIPEYKLGRNPDMKYKSAEIWVTDEKGNNFKIAEYDMAKEKFVLLEEKYSKWLK